MDFSSAAYFTAHFADILLQRKMPDDIHLLNINVPSDATSQTGWQITRLARQRYYEPTPPDRSSWSEPGSVSYVEAPILDGEADHVSGSRLIGGSSELHGGFDECFRLMGSSLITALINQRFRVLLSESQNGFRAIRTEVLRELGLRENITTIEQEMIIKTLRKGYRMGEVPTHEHKRKAGYSKIRVSRVAFRYVYSMIKYLYF